MTTTVCICDECVTREPFAPEDDAYWEEYEATERATAPTKPGRPDRRSRCTELVEALRGLVTFANVIGGYATTEQQVALWRAKAVLAAITQ